jgi:hypothetical protein
MTKGDVFYIAGTLLQLWAYTRWPVTFAVSCWCGVAYWLALLAAFKWGNLR